MLIDWCLTPTLAVFQLHRDVRKQMHLQRKAIYIYIYIFINNLYIFPLIFAQNNIYYQSTSLIFIQYQCFLISRYND